MNKFALFSIQFLGYLWYLSLFVIILPYLLVFLSEGLDYYLFESVLQWDLVGFLSMVPVELVNLVALVVIVFGAMILIESTVVLYQEAHSFPFTVIRHEELTPSKMIDGGWYGKVRHPMMLGYLISLVGLGMYVQSVAMVLWWVPLTAGLMIEYALMFEEKHMLRWFGDEYEKYQRQVPVLIPKFRKESSSKKK